MTARDAFLARVRAALGREGSPAAVPEAPAVDEDLIRLTRGGKDLVDRFLRAARGAGAAAERVEAAALQSALRAHLGEIGCRRVTVSMGEGPLRAAACAAVEEAGCRAIDWRAGPGLAAHYEAEAGITDVDAAIAESGTIVLRSSPDHSRGAFLVPPVHVAILRAADILPDLIDFWPQWSARQPPPACTVLVTGPSKTADIEGILVTGVHGPREVHVLVVG